MARIRTIKPEFWKHEELSELPPETHMLAAALLNYADDEGYFNANPKLVKAECCPLRDDSMNIPDALQALANIGYIRLGEGSDGKRYGQVVKFTDHQTISHAKPSKIKPLVSFHECSSNAPVTVHPEQGREQGTGNREGKRVDAPPRKRGRRLQTEIADLDTIPTEYWEFCVAERPNLDPERTWKRFVDYWIAQPGQKGVKADWLATWRNWVRNERQADGTGNRGGNGFVEVIREEFGG